MLDRKYILANVDQIKTNCIHRGVKCDVDKLVELESQRREKDNEAQEFNRLANEISKKIGKASPEERDALKEEARSYREKKRNLRERMRATGRRNPRNPNTDSKSISPVRSYRKRRQRQSGNPPGET